MLVRTYRLTDKFGVLLVKLSIALAEALLDGVSLVYRAILSVLLVVARPLWGILRWLLGGLLGGLLAIFGGARRTARTSMARQAARAEMTATLREDPLKSQNRTLSAVTVILLAALVSVVLWATNPARTGQTPLPVTGLSGLNDFAAAPSATPSGAVPSAAPINAVVIATLVPTPTIAASIVEVGGTLAFVARERGQTDIFAVPVGSRQPLRLTNSAEDERDPSWSPDGRRLAYASREDGNWELYALDVAAGETTRLTADPAFQGAPTWSSDGALIAYENYVNDNLEIYILNLQTGESLPLPSNSPSADFAPAWSPEGRRIAFVSWRDGSQDLYVFSLDDQSVTNVTNTPARQENYPSWSPDGTLLAYSALDEGLEKVFVKVVDDPSSEAQVMDRGRAPTWTGGGESLVFALDAVDGGQLISSPFSRSGGSTSITRVPNGATRPDWTAAALPASIIEAGGLPPASTLALYTEQEDRLNGDPPYRLNNLDGINVESPVLSDRVNDSFEALRESMLRQAGWDYLGRLDDAFWRIDRPPQPGEERRNWLMTGRAFAVQRAGILGVPPPIEIVREDIGVETYWRVFVRVAQEAQDGQRGEPLRAMPWDLVSRTEGDIEAYDQGGRLRAAMPEGYYVDLSTIAADYGWGRPPAGNDWRANANSINYWLLRKTDGLAWYAAMRELYTEGQLGGFAPTATTNPFQTPTPAITQVIFPTFTAPPPLPPPDVPPSDPNAAPPADPNTGGG